jgi:hypothetical protein
MGGCARQLSDLTAPGPDTDQPPSQLSKDAISDFRNQLERHGVSRLAVTIVPCMTESLR